MGKITPINAWQLRRLGILADMIGAVLSGYRDAISNQTDNSMQGYQNRIAEFRGFHAKATAGEYEDVSGPIIEWLGKLEALEGDVIAHVFANLRNDAVEIIYKACHNEGRKWGQIAGEKKGGASSDARKALLVLNDYLVDGLPTDNNIEVVSSEAGQITYNLNHCSYAALFEDAPVLAWVLCSSRQAWRDGFFAALGGIAHQLVSGKCQGDASCMHIITLKDQ